MEDRSEQFNEYSLIKKIKIYLQRNSDYTEITVLDNRVLSCFVSGDFYNTKLIGAFKYWGVKFEDWVDHIILSPYSRIRIKLKIILRENPNYKKCKHEYHNVMGWSNPICKKCGYFKPFTNNK